jgi:hypothetical protein
VPVDERTVFIFFIPRWLGGRDLHVVVDCNSSLAAANFEQKDSLGDAVGDAAYLQGNPVEHGHGRSARINDVSRP